MSGILRRIPRSNAKFGFNLCFYSFVLSPHQQNTILFSHRRKGRVRDLSRSENKTVHEKEKFSLLGISRAMNLKTEVEIF